MFTLLDFMLTQTPDPAQAYFLQIWACPLPETAAILIALMIPADVCDLLRPFGAVVRSGPWRDWVIWWASQKQLQMGPEGRDSLGSPSL